MRGRRGGRKRGREGGSTLAGSTGREMYWYLSQAVLGLGDRASVSKAWSGTWWGRVVRVTALYC